MKAADTITLMQKPPHLGPRTAASITTTGTTPPTPSIRWAATYWDNWSKKLTPAVVKTQREEGNFKGSWDAVGAWGEDGGRVYSTATLVLTLEAYYRYTRLVR